MYGKICVKYFSKKIAFSIILYWGSWNEKMKLNVVIKDCPWFLNHQTSASHDRDVRGSPRQLQDHERIYVFEPPDISAFPQRPKHWIWRNGMKSLKFMVSSIPKTKIYNYIILCVYFDVRCGYLLFLLSLCHELTL